MMSWRKKKGKIIIHKGDGVYFTLNRDQLDELLSLLRSVQWAVDGDHSDQPFYKEDAR